MLYFVQKKILFLVCWDVIIVLFLNLGIIGNGMLSFLPKLNSYFWYTIPIVFIELLKLVMPKWPCFLLFSFVRFGLFLLVRSICWLLCWEWSLFFWCITFLFIFICVVLIVACFCCLLLVFCLSFFCFVFIIHSHGNDYFWSYSVHHY